MFAGFLDNPRRGGRRTPLFNDIPPFFGIWARLRSDLFYVMNRRRFLETALVAASAPLAVLLTRMTQDGNHAKARRRGKEWAEIKPDAEWVVKDMVGFVPVEQYATRQVEVNEIGCVEGVRFIVARS